MRSALVCGCCLLSFRLTFGGLHEFPQEGKKACLEKITEEADSINLTKHEAWAKSWEKVAHEATSLAAKWKAEDTVQLDAFPDFAKATSEKARQIGDENEELDMAWAAAKGAWTGVAVSAQAAAAATKKAQAHAAMMRSGARTAASCAATAALNAAKDTRDFVVETAKKEEVAADGASNAWVAASAAWQSAAEAWQVASKEEGTGSSAGDRKTNLNVTASAAFAEFAEFARNRRNALNDMNREEERAELKAKAPVFKASRPEVQAAGQLVQKLLDFTCLVAAVFMSFFTLGGFVFAAIQCKHQRSTQCSKEPLLHMSSQARQL
eukprot:gnl/MRDRNA2_/MRDRNA2_18150_c0_seq1.p1 gnl/MRDRNA2_/MRDRNA2_18150_c0~~gnl/MRDRNA2_/MRDRNA2_18150_c0_seq1.p1  ORF type:complete len:323 (-),score=92.46 gnl/MRDRNA2_/MRDRNA2_18150_c0_seq1:51-1019(-)